MRALSLLALIAIGSITSCTTSISHLQTVKNEPMLIGTVSQDELFASFPVFKSNYDAFTPTPEHVALIQNAHGPIHVEVFLGTWCGDTKRNLPPFLKLLSLGKNPEIVLTLCAVDRTKKDSGGLTDKFQVTRVPTFVVLRDGKEIGRITEHPTISIGDDLTTILQK